MALWTEEEHLLKDARDQINIEMRKVTRRIANRAYSEIEADVKAQIAAGKTVSIDLSSEALQEKVLRAARQLDVVEASVLLQS
jgi:hypothetical protein